MESDCERVRIILEQEFLEAIKRRDLASFRFSDATRDIPSGLPHPDGKQRIYSTSREYSAALNELIRALKRLTDFRDRGIVPEDLKAPPRLRVQRTNQALLCYSESVKSPLTSNPEGDCPH